MVAKWSVRQSVLLGVSDAIEQLGTLPITMKFIPVWLRFCRVEKAEDKHIESTSPARQGARSNNRKRLGRSLKDLDQSTATA